MKILNLLTYILDISLIFISGFLVVDAQFFSFGVKESQTRKKEGLFRASLSTNMAIKSHPVSFLLFTRKNKILPEFMTVESARLSPYFSRAKETKIILHSFMQGATDKIFLQIKDAYLDKKDLNVILVDWPHARFFTYSISATVTEHIGLETVRLIKALRPPLDKIHIIGFGLGAHSAGVVGAELNSKVGRITGLDPSMPLFRMLDDYFKLDENDGKFVDIIHTDAGDNFWFANHLGLGKPSGSVDFYPNKGIFQPGCLNTSILNYEDMYCSHIRSLELFAESIENPDGLMACKCNTWISFMGAKCDCMNEENLIAVGEGRGTDVKNITGKYYLITNEKKPFGMGKVGSRSPRENTLNDIMESLDELYSITVNKEKRNSNKSSAVNLRSLADELFTEDEIKVLNSLRLFDKDKKEEESVALNGNEENCKETDVDVTLQEILEMNTTPAPLNITENPEHEIESENHSDYEIVEEDEDVSEQEEDADKNENTAIVDDDEENTFTILEEMNDPNSTKTTKVLLKENKESNMDKDERNNKLHLLYIIGTLKSGQNIDSLKEYRILK